MGFGNEKGGGGKGVILVPFHLPRIIRRERRNVGVFHRNNLRRGVTAYHPKTAITLIVHPRATVRRMGRRTQLWPRQPLSTSGQLFLNLPKVTSCLVGSANTADVIIKTVFIKRSLESTSALEYIFAFNWTKLSIRERENAKKQNKNYIAIRY